jgi:peptidoglycan/xylan/chitin deacetylase (PgdA/CDA1 family)
MELLRSRSCAVLPLGEALARLSSGTLPPRAVSITFDDGFHDFYRLAWPILRRFSFPATVYLATYYSDRSQWPVFDVMLCYVLWKSRGRQLACPGILPTPIALDTAGCTQANDTIQAHCLNRQLSGADRHDLLKTVCQQLDFDLDDAIRSRILCLMNREEVKRVAAQGADIQLHTHRHRVFARRERFWQEIDDNRERIRSQTGITPSHFCYPGGFCLPDFPLWLRARAVESATTCEAGLASRKSDPYLLPRVLDVSGMTQEEFDAWICGVADFLPKRIYAPSLTQLGQEPNPEATIEAAGARQ